MTTNGYLFKEGFDNLRKHSSKTRSTILVICATMFVVGIFLLIFQNVNYNVDIITKEQGFQAFINDSTKEDELNYMQDQIEILDGVNEVFYISKEMAFEDALNLFEGEEYFLDGLESVKPFPASFVITFNDLEKANSIKASVEKISGIYEVRYNESTINAVIAISKIANYVLIGIAGILLVISIFIISSTIKLAVYSNKREIYIMKYIGATDSFIRSPFIIEGAIMGVISSIMSFVIISIIYILLYSRVSNYGTSLGTFGLIPYSGLWYQIFGVFIGLGIVIGIIGSMISITKYLKD